MLMLGEEAAAAAEKRLEDLQRQVEERNQRYTTLAARVQAVAVTERSSDGAIRATVDANGALTGLQFTEAIKERSAAQMAAAVMTCVQRAQARLAEQVGQVIAGTVPADDRAGQEILSSFQRRFPEPVAEPSLPPRPQRFVPPDEDDGDDLSNRTYLR
ncbi:YbaB/EbfC family DNA-binding protein [Pseudonocardiaceae bacterium YIM PH 21723]|nr:YbaB/EbfC family DNA-binding protein [Pseudonocardiaceae bacterium YIM PH 21723]